MRTNTPISSQYSFRDHHRRHLTVSRTQSSQEHISLVNERIYPIKLRRRRAQAARSFYDNTEDDEEEPIASKWTIVRQRLPDILALSQTYKPKSVRAQLVLLISLMNKQAEEAPTQSRQLNINEYNNTISHIVPSNVLIDISGRTQLICLKRIPPDQVIHVDIDNLAFAIPTRQFILAISRGYAHETAARYCPPAIGDMLIDLSKTKFAADRLKYKRAQFKMRLGQLLFLAIFIFIIAMMLTLIISAVRSLLDIDRCKRENL